MELMVKVSTICSKHFQISLIFLKKGFEFHVNFLPGTITSSNIMYYKALYSLNIIKKGVKV